MLRKLLGPVIKVFPKKTKVLTPKSREEELDILVNDDKDFTNTIEYLRGLIYKIMKKYNLNEEDEEKNYKKIIEFLPKIVNNYLSKGEEKRDYKFSTYFTWWAKEIIEKEIKIS